MSKFDGLELGLYLIRWIEDGGESEVAIYNNPEGFRCIVATNWVRPGRLADYVYKIDNVKKIEIENIGTVYPDPYERALNTMRNDTVRRTGMVPEMGMGYGEEKKHRFDYVFRGSTQEEASAPKPMPPQNCSTCNFISARSTGIPAKGLQKTCRRYPEEKDVSSGYWCGEYKQMTGSVEK